MKENKIQKKRYRKSEKRHVSALLVYIQMNSIKIRLLYIQF